MQNKLLFYGMILILVGLVVAQIGIQSADNEESTQGSGSQENQPITSDDPAMQAAFEQARKRLDYFFDVVDREPEGTQGYSLKVGVQEGDTTEFFWVYPFERTNEGFKGRINDEPQKVDQVFKGQMLEFQRHQIVDWTFDDTQTEVMHGNYTGCVELQREAPDHAEQLMELYGLKCEKVSPQN